MAAAVASSFRNLGCARVRVLSGPALPASIVTLYRSYSSAAAATSPVAPSASTSHTVPLVYDLHKPVTRNPSIQVLDPQTSPIIFMHGLFGSKKNNRSISK